MKSPTVLFYFLTIFISFGQLSSQFQNKGETNHPTFSISQPWINQTVSLVSDGPSTTQLSTRSMQEVVAKYARYQPIDTNGLPVQADGQPWFFPIVMMTNPVSQKICFIEKRDLYFATEAGLIGSTLPFRGSLTCIKSYLEVSATVGTTDAVQQFEQKFDPKEIFRMQQSNFSVNLRLAAPPRFFAGPDSGIAYSAPAKVKAIDCTDGVLRIQIKGMNLQEEGTFWVNLASAKVIRSIINGSEMDLSNTNRFAVPKTNGL